MASKDPEVFSITGAQQPLSREQTARTRRYLISMGIRTGCVIGAIFIPGWPRWVLIAGAVILPYLAVVIANGGRDKATGGSPESTQRALPSRYSHSDT
jgi:hypothetical protein